MDHTQVTCSNESCGGVVLIGDRFCGTCGTPVPDVRRPPPWPGTAAGTAASRGDEPLYSHEPRRTSGPPSNITRFLCAAAYLNQAFANRVIWHLLATRRAVAPSISFDVGPVLRHCLRARRNILIREVLLMAIVIAGLAVKTVPTLDFLLLALSLGGLLPRAGRRRSGRLGALAYALGTAAGVTLAIVLLAFLALDSYTSSLALTGSMASAIASLISPVFSFALLLAAAWATEFVYLRTTFRTLAEDLRRDAGFPRAMSEAAEERIAMVEGAQWGNVTLHGGRFPFVGAGPQSQVHWSIAIRLRRKDPGQRWLEQTAGGGLSPAGKYVQIDPVDLHQRIRARLLTLNDPALPDNERIAALTVSDRVVGSGRLDVDDPLFDANLRTPYSHASQEAIEALIRHPQARLRYYQQVSVSDESPAVESHGREVARSLDQEVSVSAFVYAAVEGRMFYLQFVLTALPPIRNAYRVVVAYGSSFIGTLLYSLRRLFRAVTYALPGIFYAFRLWHTERQTERAYLSRGGGDFGAQISVRQMATASWFASYIQELDVEKYNMMISRLLLETVQEYLDSEGVDTSAFADSAQTIVNNGDFNYIGENYAKIDQFGGRGNTHNESPSSGPDAQ